MTTRARAPKLTAFAALTALAGSGLAATTPGPGPVLNARHDLATHGDVRLISDVASVRPGVPFTVGLHVTLDRGWRTPWKNAGDVGNGMLATWTLPDGFRADSFAYPIPELVAHPPVASYGYHEEVVFLATITPSADVETGESIRLGLSADLVLCGHTCIPVHAERTLELPVREAPPAASDDAALIRRHAARVPVEHARWTVRAARTAGGFVLGIAPPADWNGTLAGARFFPADPALLDHAADQPVSRTASGEYNIRLTESAYLAREPERIEGVLVLPEGTALDAAGRRGLVVNAAIAATAEA